MHQDTWFKNNWPVHSQQKIVNIAVIQNAARNCFIMPIGNCGVVSIFLVHFGGFFHDNWKNLLIFVVFLFIFKNRWVSPFLLLILLFLLFLLFPSFWWLCQQCSRGINVSISIISYILPWKKVNISIISYILLTLSNSTIPTEFHSFNTHNPEYTRWTSYFINISSFSPQNIIFEAK